MYVVSKCLECVRAHLRICAVGNVYFTHSLIATHSLTINECVSANMGRHGCWHCCCWCVCVCVVDGTFVCICRTHSDSKAWEYVCVAVDPIVTHTHTPHAAQTVTHMLMSNVSVRCIGVVCVCMLPQ